MRHLLLLLGTLAACSSPPTKEEPEPRAPALLFARTPLATAGLADVDVTIAGLILHPPATGQAHVVLAEGVTTIAEADTALAFELRWPVPDGEDDVVHHLTVGGTAPGGAALENGATFDVRVRTTLAASCDAALLTAGEPTTCASTAPAVWSLEPADAGTVSSRGAVVAASAGALRVVATSTARPSLSAHVDVQVLAALATPQISTVAGLSVGRTAPATVPAVSGITSAWSVSNGLAIDGSATGEIITLRAVAAGTATVTVVASNAAGARRTVSRDVVVADPLVPCVVRAPKTVAAGRVHAMATVAAVPGLTYRWSVTNGFLEGTGTGPVLSFTASGTPGQLTLTCTAINAIGDEVAAMTTVTIVPRGFVIVAGSFNPGTADRLLGGSMPASFSSPRGMSVLDDGRVLIADTANNCVRLLTLGPTDADNAVSTLPGAPCGGALLSGPQGVTGRIVDAAGNLEVFVADSINHRVMRWLVSPGGAGTLTVLAGVTASAGPEDGTVGTGTAPRFSSPTDVVLDAPRNCLYVAEYGNNAIRKVTLGTPVTVSTLVGLAGTSGTTYGTLASPVQGTSARLTQIHGVTISPDGAWLFAAENGNEVIRVDLTTASALTSLWATPTGFHRHIALDGTGVPVVTSTPQNVVQRATTPPTTMLGDGMSVITSNGVLPGSFDDPDGIVYEPYSGDFLVTSSNQHVIARVRY